MKHQPQYFYCKKCKSECIIEQIKHNYYECFCYKCNKTALGFDPEQQYIDHISSITDETYDRLAGK
jgi:hypothetical protein